MLSWIVLVFLFLDQTPFWPYWFLSFLLRSSICSPGVHPLFLEMFGVSVQRYFVVV